MNKRISKELNNVSKRKSKVVSGIAQKAKPENKKKNKKDDSPSSEEMIKKELLGEENVEKVEHQSRQNIFEKLFADDSFEHIEISSIKQEFRNDQQEEAQKDTILNEQTPRNIDSDDSFGDFFEKTKQRRPEIQKPKMGFQARQFLQDDNLEGDEFTQLITKSKSQAPAKQLKKTSQITSELVKSPSKQKKGIKQRKEEKEEIYSDDNSDEQDKNRSNKGSSHDLAENVEKDIEGNDIRSLEDGGDVEVGYRNPNCIPVFLQKETRRDKYGNLMSSPDYDPTTLLMTEEEMAQIKPFLREYWRVKCAHFDKIVLVKLGRFYEAFFEDAEVCKLILNPKYTRKYKIGFPEELFNPYLRRLTENNLKIVIIEQMETVKQQKTRIEEMKKRGEKVTEEAKLIKREVSAIYSKGTAALQIVRSRKLQLSPNNYILSLVTEKGVNQKAIDFSLCFFDSMTGKVLLTHFEDDSILSTFTKLIYIYQPQEILYQRKQVDLDSLRLLSALPSKPLTTEINDPNAWDISTCLEEISTIFGSGLERKNWPCVLNRFSDSNRNHSSDSLVLSAFGALIHYMKANLLFDETIPVANYVYLDHRNNREVSDYDLSQLCGDVKLEEELNQEQNNSNMCIEKYQIEDNQFSKNSRLVLDAQTLSSLDILEISYGNESQNAANKAFSLYKILNQTSTPFGSRLMKLWVSSPLLNKKDIEERLDSIEDLNAHRELSDSFRQELLKLSDLENILLRLYSYRVKHKGRGVYFEDVSVQRLSELRKFIKELSSILNSMNDTLFTVCQNFKSERLKMLVGHIQDSWVKCEKGIHKSCLSILNKIESKVLWVGASNNLPTPMIGLCPTYDRTIEAIEQLDLKAQLYLNTFREQLNNDQRIKFNNYQTPFAIEIPKSLLPKLQIRNDLTLTSMTTQVSRYTTPETIEIANAHTSLQDQLKQLLSDFTCVLFDEFFKHRNNWNQAVNVIAELDCLLALSTVSFSSELKTKAGRMTRPVFTQPSNDQDLSYIQGINCYHPSACLSSKSQFVPNNIIINSDLEGTQFKRIQLITGPNMGGKSTYLRSASLLIIMAQIGCYVPCDYFEFSLFDRLFTRIGLNDTLPLNKSTFYVELEETLHIVRNASKRSLILIDELGRGTSTFDGVSLASGVISHILNKNKSCCLFSTHSNLLVEEFRHDPNVQCLQMSIEDPNEQSNRVIFRYKLVDGEAQSSFALNILEMVGLDPSIIFKSKFMSSILCFIAKPVV